MQLKPNLSPSASSSPSRTRSGSTGRRPNKAKKKLRHQTLVITGASSGIGLSTAKAAARQGAKVVLVARNQRALDQAVSEIRAEGGDAYSIAADMTCPDEVNRVVQQVTLDHGGFDTWINNAGVSVYGRLTEVSEEDHRQVMETNFWGVVNGSLAALPVLTRRGGTLINVGSALSDRAIGMQGMYSATKHAIKGYTDALRMELRRDRSPVAVTLIKPGSINTPYTRHAKNYTGRKLTLPAPVYDPTVVAAAILHAAEKPLPHLTVGGGGKLISALGNRFPGLMDLMMVEGGAIDQQFRDEPSDRADDNVHSTQEADPPREDGDYEGMVRETSTFTTLRKHPVLTGLAVTALSAAAVAGLRALLAGGREAPDAPHEGELQYRPQPRTQASPVQTYPPVGQPPATEREAAPMTARSPQHPATGYTHQMPRQPTPPQPRPVVTGGYVPQPRITGDLPRNP